jgi:hypothetical protein
VLQRIRPRDAHIRPWSSLIPRYCTGTQTMAGTTQSLSSETQHLLFGGHLNGSKPRPSMMSHNVSTPWSYDSLLLLLSELGTPTRLCATFLLLLLPFALTYGITSLLFKATRWSSVRGRRAPLVPYSIPLVGHAMAFAFSVADLIQGNL